VGACLEIGTTEVAFSERERNLVEPALFPLFGLLSSKTDFRSRPTALLPMVAIRRITLHAR